MSFLPRKLTFQLTPLLDLLLIVIFAQYMEMRETVHVEADDRQAAEAKLGSLSQQRERELKSLSETRRQLETFRSEQSELAKALEKRNFELRTALRRALEQQKRVGDLVAELFQVPDELIQQALNPKNLTQPARSPEEIKRLHAAFQELAQKQGRAVLQHLLTYEELRKRCDIWEIYVAEDGLIHCNTGSPGVPFRAETAGHFERVLFQRYKGLPDTKRLVIILFSYGDAKAGPRQAVLDGLPTATARMQADSNGQTRFEYADLGYNPDRPASRSPK